MLFMARWRCNGADVISITRLIMQLMCLSCTALSCCNISMLIRDSCYNLTSFVCNIILYKIGLDWIGSDRIVMVFF